MKKLVFSILFFYLFLSCKKESKDIISVIKIDGCEYIIVENINNGNKYIIHKQNCENHKNP